MLTLYHNPSCKKSRAALLALQQTGEKFQVIEYLKKPLTSKDWEQLFKKLNRKAKDMVRTQEEVFRKQYKGKNFTETEWLYILTENPRLIQRPVVEAKHKAVLGDPVDTIFALFNNKIT